MITKVSNIVLSCFLLLATTGVPISMHFCKDHLAGVEFFDEASGCTDETIAGCCSGKTASHCTDENIDKEGCCKNVNSFVKFCQPFQMAKSQFLPAVPEFVSDLHLTFVRPPQSFSAFALTETPFLNLPEIPIRFLALLL